MNLEKVYIFELSLSLLAFTGKPASLQVKKRESHKRLIHCIFFKFKISWNSPAGLCWGETLLRFCATQWSLPMLTMLTIIIHITIFSIPFKSGGYHEWNILNEISVKNPSFSDYLFNPRQASDSIAYTQYVL